MNKKDKIKLEQAIGEIEVMAAAIQFGGDERVSNIKWGQHIPEELQGERDGLMRAAKHLRQKFGVKTKSRF